MKWMVGHLFDGWNNLRYAAQELGKAMDRAMVVWDE